MDSSFEKLRAVFGSWSGVARAAGVGPGAVGNWKSRGAVPHLQVAKLVEASDGALSASDLRPDLWPAVQKRGRKGAAA